jgi:hypothetical protein
MISHASPEGAQSHVTTVPKHLADDLADALRLITESSNKSANGFRIWAKHRASQALTEYRKATQ